MVEVDGTRYTAEHVVLANGADADHPAGAGLRELDGVWTNREATGMKAVPRRLLVLGGGPVGVEMAQAVRRLGGEVVLVERSERLLAREPAPLGEALGEVLRRDGVELVLGVGATRRPPRRRGLRARRSTTAASCAATSCSSPPAGARACEGIGLETVGIEPDPHGVPVDAHLRVGERLWAIGDVTGILPLTHVGKYQGDVRRRQHPRRRRARPTTRRSRA